MSSFEFESMTQTGPASYVDFESILASKSIVCIQDTASNHVPTAPAPVSEPRRPTFEQMTAPVAVQLKTTNTTIVPPAKKADRKAQRDELFGIDFSDEMLVDISLADAVAKPNTSTPAFPVRSSDVRSHVARAHAARAHEPAAEEIWLHSEILQMSQNAKIAGDTRSPSRTATSWAPVSYLNDDSIDELPLDSVDVPSQMAVVWHDDEPLESTLDDRDMLVIEDEVTIIVDQPSSGGIGSGAMRQPTAPVEQHYQSLFSRLRSGK